MQDAASALSTSLQSNGGSQGIMVFHILVHLPALLALSSASVPAILVMSLDLLLYAQT